MIRVVLPYHLRNLAQIQSEVRLDLEGEATIEAVLDALEGRYPMLRGTIRHHDTKVRRPFIRYFVCGEDLSLEPTDTRLPEKIIEGKEPFMVVGAIAGG